MFCYQCEQSQKGNCHTQLGVCGKDETTAVLQDVLIYAAKGLAKYSYRLRQMGIKNATYDKFLLDALFTTVTNVNFDPERIHLYLEKAEELISMAKEMYEGKMLDQGKTPEIFEKYVDFKYNKNTSAMLLFGGTLSLELKKNEKGADLVGVEELILYGVKGLAAYAHHAAVLGAHNDEIYEFINYILDYLTEDHPLEDLFGKALEAGRINLVTMEILDKAHTDSFGHPVPSPVRINPIKGKAILVSGHDLKDLEVLLQQTEGTGINIYTHGEMLPAHGYPELNKYDHLVGNYGGAWQDQHKEFEAFPGAILMTTNCIQKPKESYVDRIFTSGLVAWPGVKHISDLDFKPVIDCALSMEGFAADDEDDKTILTGFGHNAVMSVADKVIEGVKSGAIKHFYLIGGCDGAKSGRNYYTDFAQSVPEDSVILTLACGKFRFNKLDFGDIGGIPRLLDIGQCNDAYSAIKIASALAEAFEVGVNDLPLSFILSWYEQKAVAILLTLLYLDIKNIKLGPTLPIFLEPIVLSLLVEKYGIAPIGTVEEDLAATLA
jgi:hydroxylamine reductase